MWGVGVEIGGRVKVAEGRARMGLGQGSRGGKEVVQEADGR